MVECSSSGALPLDTLRARRFTSGAQTWFAWFEDFLIRGNNSTSHEKNGKLTFLASDMRRELGTIRLSNLGIFRLRAGPGPTDGIRKLTAELYCQRMELRLPGAGRPLPAR
ncbi:MAG: hypothetical protein ACR2OZ_17250 [Verrucomicrobiales bacterium]